MTAKQIADKALKSAARKNAIGARIGALDEAFAALRAIAALPEPVPMCVCGHNESDHDGDEGCPQECQHSYRLSESKGDETEYATCDCRGFRLRDFTPAGDPQ